MSFGEQTIKCPICGNPYVVYSHYAGDQSACPPCRRRARQPQGGYKHDYTDTTVSVEDVLSQQIREGVRK